MRGSADDKNSELLQPKPNGAGKNGGNKDTSINGKVEHNAKKEFNLDILAKAVARHETASCTKGYGKEYNNCFGIKWGNTAPCDNVGRNKMCIYDHPDESYEAFKKIWSTWYGQMPTLKTAQIYSGNDRAITWLNNVTNFYYEYAK